MTSVAERNLLKNNKPVDPGDNSQHDLRALLRDTQGNILKPHGRDHVHHLFVQFGPKLDEKGRKWLATMSKLVTSAMSQWDDSTLRAAKMAAAKAITDPTARKKAIAKVRAESTVFVNLMLSYKGYVALRLKPWAPSDKGFERGGQHEQTRWKLNDPPLDTWQDAYTKDLHALVVVANDNTDSIAATVATIKQALAGAGRIVHEETGSALRLDHNGKEREDGPVREHFGYLDGISNPLFYAKDLKGSERGTLSDPFAPLGLVLLPDPGATKGGCGSYVAFRKLRQHVARFKADKTKFAEKLRAADKPTGKQPKYYEDLAGAYIFGRFTDGTPVVRQSKPSGDPVGDLSVDFDYQNDRAGTKCPLASHIRKSNPRGDATSVNKSDPEYERSHRIARRGMSYGPRTLKPKDTDDVGMLFMCVQASIVDQFEFLRNIWCDQKDFPLTGTGRDPLIGNPPDAKSQYQRWPRTYGASGPDKYLDKVGLGPWVTLRGAEYFFMPSVSFLATGGRP